MNRTQLAISNIFYAYISKILSFILNFATRTVFLLYLSEEYLGFNSLMLSIVGMLSVADLGIGTAMGFTLYEPIAKNDKTKVVICLNYFKKIYYGIAGSILVLGLLFSPFLTRFVDISMTPAEIYFCFFLHLVNTAVSYLVSYKFIYIHAIQKSYIVSNIYTILDIVVKLLQIFVLVIFKSFFAYLSIQILVLLVSRIYINTYVNKKEHILQEKTSDKMSNEDKINFYDNIKGMIWLKLSSVAISSVDNILLATIQGVGLITIARISNYNLVITSVLAFVTILFSSFTSGFGNMYVTESKNKIYKLYKEIRFVNFWCHGFCHIAFFVLLDSFITLWLGDTYLINRGLVLLIVSNSFLTAIITPLGVVRTSIGDYSRDKYVHLFKAILNVIISVIGLYYWGVMGIYFATFISIILADTAEVVIMFRFLFDKSCVYYFKETLYYIFIVSVALIATNTICQFIMNEVSILSFVLSMIVVTIVPNIIILLMCFFLPQYKGAMQRIANIINNKLDNIKNRSK